MRHPTDPIENLLTELGGAHQEGVFSSTTKRYPWRAVEPEAAGLTHRRLAWVRVGVPLAAAAAVAVLFVGPNLFDAGAVREIAEDLPVTVLSEKPETLADAEAVVTTAETVECDYNGDGEIDGRDIQAFLDRSRDTGGEQDLEAAFFQQCLLGG